MRQGNDVGTQYRSAIYTHSAAQRAAAEASRDVYQRVLTTAGYGQITTEIAPRRPTISPRTTTSSTWRSTSTGYCPNHETGVKLPDDFAMTPLQYVD